MVLKRRVIKKKLENSKEPQYIVEAKQILDTTSIEEEIQKRKPSQSVLLKGRKKRQIGKNANRHC